MTFTVEDAILGSTLVPVIPVVHLRRSLAPAEFYHAASGLCCVASIGKVVLDSGGLADRNGGGGLAAQRLGTCTPLPR